jgi:hypothetical protein
MTLTYDAAESSDRDRVRGKIGDTDANRELLDDDTVDAVLELYPSVTSAAIECCRRIIAKLARDVDRGAIGTNASRSQAISNYKDLISMLQSELLTHGRMFVGGESLASNESQSADTGAVQPSFAVGMLDGDP